MITAITAALGIAATLLAWFLNPKRVLYSQLDSIFKQLETLYVKRDDALAKNDIDTITVITADIVKLCETKNRLLQRLK